MTKQEALNEGFIYYGKFGLARIFMSHPTKGEPMVAARGFFSEIVLDIQEAIVLLMDRLGVQIDTMFYVQGRIDGQEFTQAEWDSL